jgi:hypothetical protein
MDQLRRDDQQHVQGRQRGLLQRYGHSSLIEMAWRAFTLPAKDLATTKNGLPVGSPFFSLWLG